MENKIHFTELQIAENLLREGDVKEFFDNFVGDSTSDNANFLVLEIMQLLKGTKEISFEAAEIIADEVSVDEALRDFLDDPSEDTAAKVILQITKNLEK